MTVRWYTLAVDCRDAPALARWWAGVLDWQVTYEGDDEVVIGPRHAVDGQSADIPVEQRAPALAFGPVPEGKQVKNRVHFDLVPTDRTRDEEIERVLALGAMPLDDRRQPDGSGWLVLTDPEGNEFCILRSDAERGTSV